MTIQEIHALFLQTSGIAIDTRKITQDSFFVAIKGERFDANTFTAEALEKGAKYVLIDNETYFIDNRTVLVQDSLTALQDLATYHRQYLKLPIIALTGSNGKTTTKELVNVVLAKKYRVKATIGNLNNHIGVPLTLLSFDQSTQIGIVEMGANHQKEIEFLCNIAKPDYGFITNFGKAHLEGFGGVEGVIKGKSEMYTFLAKNHKTTFVNLDDALQSEKTVDFNRITFSQTNPDATVFIESVAANPFVKVKALGTDITSRLIGLYNATNICMAITIGCFFKVPIEDIKTAIESYVPDNNRSQLMVKHTNEIILDAYNANPSSMRVALENFIQLDKPDKIIVIGDMYELGQESKAEHKSIVDFLSTNESMNCYFVGKDFYANQLQKANFFFYETFEDFAKAIASLQWQNKTILIKGSRGMALERTLEFL